MPTALSTTVNTTVTVLQNAGNWYYGWNGTKQMGLLFKPHSAYFDNASSVSLFCPSFDMPYKCNWFIRTKYNPNYFPSIAVSGDAAGRVGYTYNPHYTYVAKNRYRYTYEHLERIPAENILAMDVIYGRPREFMAHNVFNPGFQAVFPGGNAAFLTSGRTYGYLNSLTWIIGATNMPNLIQAVDWLEQDM